jgi:hypothetical protein
MLLIMVFSYAGGWLVTRLERDYAPAFLLLRYGYQADFVRGAG